MQNAMRVVGVTLALLMIGLPASSQVISVGTTTVPQQHIVQKGDTLWDICGQYFRDPWRWPNVWALNAQITNPHWIYPGDIVRLRMGDGAPAPTVFTTNLNSTAVVSQNIGYIAEGKVENAGRLAHSPLARGYLGESDLVYLKMPKLDEVKIGQRYSIFTFLDEVTHPKDGSVMGRKVEVMGVVEVKSVEDNFARAEIRRSFREIERGMYIGELLEHLHVVSPRQNLIDLQGAVVDTMRKITELGQHHLIFLDRGAKDGVQVGNRFFVLRRGDGFDNLKLTEDQAMPWEQIGEVIVLETQDRNSTAMLTRAALEARRGDRIVMKRHY